MELIEVGEPRPLAGDKVLLEVMAAGVGNWDEFVRAGGWDVGGEPPMALGVEAADIVLAAGESAITLAHQKGSWPVGSRPRLSVWCSRPGSSVRNRQGCRSSRCGGLRDTCVPWVPPGRHPKVSHR